MTEEMSIISSEAYNAAREILEIAKLEEETSSWWVAPPARYPART